MTDTIEISHLNPSEILVHLIDRMVLQQQQEEDENPKKVIVIKVNDVVLDFEDADDDDAKSEEEQEEIMNSVLEGSYEVEVYDENDEDEVIEALCEAIEAHTGWCVYNIDYELIDTETQDTQEISK